MTTDTLFRPQAGGGGTGTTDYIKDLFLDTSRVASNNSGFSSTLSSNPLSQNFNDTDSPQYGTKTLFIKGLVEITDKTKWINSKPTYQIVFTENFPQLKAYAYGNVRILDTTTGFCLYLGDVNDACGIVGNIRQVAWVMDVTSQTGTLSTLQDNVAGSALTYGSSATDVEARGYNNFNLLLQNSTIASNDLHDFRITADQPNLARVAGIMVLFQNASSNIQCQPGSTYVNKSLSTTTTAVGVTLPVIAGRLGANSLVYKTTAPTYALNNLEPTALETIGLGSSGTNLVNVTTNQGASFPVGTLVAGIASGASYYFGIVTNQSTDTLTVGPTLTFGMSGPLYKYGYAGTTFNIGASNYLQSYEINPATVVNFLDPQSFGATSGTLFYQDPQSRFRIWGSNIFSGTIDGVAGIMFQGASGFLQLEGRFAALDFEHISRGIFHATFSINGLNCFGLNTGFSGIFKRSILTDGGPGWNTVVIAPGASFNANTNAISKLSLYDLNNQGVTAGLLAQFPTFMNQIPRTTFNATLLTLGSIQKHFADELYLTGAWTRATGASFSGGVAYYGASTNSTLKFQYYGTDFSFIGTVGGSMTTLLDGASISSAFNAIKSVATLGWHTVQSSYNAGATAIIEAIALVPSQTGELKSLQNYNSDNRFLNIPAIYQQAQTPDQAKDGDMWLQGPPNARSFPLVWVKAFGLWMQIPISNFSADPNYDELFITGGSLAGTSKNNTQKFNQVSWISSVSSLTIKIQAGKSSAQYNARMYFAGGIDGVTVYTENEVFNKSSWLQDVVVPAARTSHANYSAFGFYWVNKGSSDGTAANAQSAAYKYNGSAWATAAVWTGNNLLCGCFFLNQFLWLHGGDNTSGTAITTLLSRNSADTIATSTASPSAMDRHGSSNVNSSLAMSAQGLAGDSATSYTWDGTSWSSALTAPYSSQSGCAAFSSSRSLFYGLSGNTGGTDTTNNFQFNGISFVSNQALTAARSQATAGSF